MFRSDISHDISHDISCDIFRHPRPNPFFFKFFWKIIVFICAFRKCLIFSSDACCKAHLALYLAICLTIYLIIYRKIFVAKDVSDIWRYIVRYIARYRRILGAANIRRYLAIYLTIKDKLNYLTSMPRPDNIGKPCSWVSDRVSKHAGMRSAARTHRCSGLRCPLMFPTMVATV